MKAKAQAALALAKKAQAGVNATRLSAVSGTVAAKGPTGAALAAKAGASASALAPVQAAQETASQSLQAAIQSKAGQPMAQVRTAIKKAADDRAKVRDAQKLVSKILAVH